MSVNPAAADHSVLGVKGPLPSVRLPGAGPPSCALSCLSPMSPATSSRAALGLASGAIPAPTPLSNLLRNSGLCVTLLGAPRRESRSHQVPHSSPASFPWPLAHPWAPGPCWSLYLPPPTCLMGGWPPGLPCPCHARFGKGMPTGKAQGQCHLSGPSAIPPMTRGPATLAANTCVSSCPRFFPSLGFLIF